MIEVNNEIGAMFVDALLRRYESEMLEAKAILAVYVNNLSGIGEHSDLMEEHDKWIEKYTNAKDKFENVKELFQISVRK